MMPLSLYTWALLAGGASAQLPPIPCTIEIARQNRQCPQPDCVPPKPCADGTIPPEVDEIDPYSEMCCLKACNFVCEGDPSNPCAGWTWPPPGSRQCQSDRECYPGEACECQASQCDCDPTTGKAGSCTDDCINTCQGGAHTRVPNPSQSCGPNNGNCPEGTECHEKEVQCLVPPCQVQITCQDGEGNVILQLFKGHMNSDNNPAMFVEWRQNSQGGGTLVSVDGAGTALVWEGPTGEILNSIATEPEGVVAPWSPDTRNIALGRDFDVSVYPALDASTTPSDPLFTIPAPTGMWGSDVIWIGNPSQPQLAVAWGEKISLFDGTSGTMVRELTGHTDAVTSLSAPQAAAGTTTQMIIYSGSQDGTVRSWDYSSGTQLGSVTAHTDGVSVVRVDRDGMNVATGGVRDFTVNVFAADLKSSDPMATFIGHTDRITALDWHPLGEGCSQSGDVVRCISIASGSLDGTVQLWAHWEQRPQAVSVFRGLHKVRWLDWSPEGTKYAVAGDSKVMIVQWSEGWPGGSNPPGPHPPVPPMPPVPTGCFDALEQTCPADNADLCRQCISSLGFILERAGCTDSDFAEFCVATQPCDEALHRAGCLSAETTTDACLDCASTKQNTDLKDSQCTFALVLAECRKLAPRPADCLQALQSGECASVAGSGQVCEACIEGQLNRLMEAGCSYNTTATFCNGDTPTGTCEDVLNEVCTREKGTGSDCYTCLAQNQDPIRRVSCSNQQLQAFCKVDTAPQPPEQKCQSVLNAACPKNPNQDQTKCLRCVSSKLSQLMADCTQENAVDYCMV